MDLQICISTGGLLRKHHITTLEDLLSLHLHIACNNGAEKRILLLIVFVGCNIGTLLLLLLVQEAIPCNVTRFATIEAQPWPVLHPPFVLGRHQRCLTTLSTLL